MSSTARRPEIPNGLWGLLVFLCTEGTFLTCVVGAYFYLDLTSPNWPPAGIPAPSAGVPILLTAGLALTLVPVVAAARAARAGRTAAVLTFVAVALVLQGVYLGLQVLEFLSDLDDFSFTGTAYGSVYFTMLAADHAHVALGLLGNLWLLASVRRGLTPYRATAVRVLAWYWAFVVAMSVLILVAQVSPS